LAETAGAATLRRITPHYSLHQNRRLVVALFAVIALTVAGPAGAASNPVASSSPTSVDFGSVPVGQTSTPVTVTLTNAGSAPLKIAAFGINAASVNQADFVLLAGGTCSVASPVAEGKSCTALVRFKPTATGFRSGILRFWVNTAAGRLDVALSGTAMPGSLPDPSASPASVDFGAVAVGQTSDPVTVTVTNAGPGTLEFASFGITAASVNQSDFVLLSGGTCSAAATVAAGQSCTARVRFKPTAEGARSGLLRFWANTATGKLDVPLSGIATSGALPDPSASPSEVDFGALAVGQTSPPATVTVTNNGSGPLQFAALGITAASANQSDFVLLAGGSCSVASALGAGESCTALVRFKPTAEGARGAILRFWVNTVEGRLDVALTGTATSGALPDPSVLPGDVDFGQVMAGDRSSPVTVTVTNNGAGTLQFSALGITAASINQSDFVLLSGGSCAAATTLASGQDCTAIVQFRPTAVGPRSGVLRFWVNTVAGYVDVALTGEGDDPCGLGCF
jgi:archaellum component FlaF (FlaF/FlaG flagellin family)